jgi:hypothetical protein
MLLVVVLKQIHVVYIFVCNIVIRTYYDARCYHYHAQLKFAVKFHSLYRHMHASSKASSSHSETTCFPTNASQIMVANRKDLLTKIHIVHCCELATDSRGKLQLICVCPRVILHVARVVGVGVIGVGAFERVHVEMLGYDRIASELQLDIVLPSTLHDNLNIVHIDWRLLVPLGTDGI